MLAAMPMALRTPQHDVAKHGVLNSAVIGKTKSTEERANRGARSFEACARTFAAVLWNLFKKDWRLDHSLPAAASRAPVRAARCPTATRGRYSSAMPIAGLFVEQLLQYRRHRLIDIRPLLPEESRTSGTSSGAARRSLSRVRHRPAGVPPRGHLEEGRLDTESAPRAGELRPGRQGGLHRSLGAPQLRPRATRGGEASHGAAVLVGGGGRRRGHVVCQSACFNLQRASRAASSANLGAVKRRADSRKASSRGAIAVGQLHPLPTSDALFLQHRNLPPLGCDEPAAGLFGDGTPLARPCGDAFDAAPSTSMNICRPVLAPGTC